MKSVLIILLLANLASAQERPRLQDLGISVGVFSRGPLNAITDLSGVHVGHVTLNRGDSIRTGVTAILPHGGNVFQMKVPGAVHVGNGFGKLIGSTQIDELGEIETPIVLTNTLSVWDAANGIVDHMLSLPGNEHVGSINPVVGETNDGQLNDIRGRQVTRGDVVRAIREAKAGPVEEGSVGAGAGTVCFGWKGGIGTSSRVLPSALGQHTVGVLVQTNFGGVLDLAGVPVGKELEATLPKRSSDDGSCMIIIATDAPVSVDQLRRLARRAPLALGRTGSAMSHGSGDYVIAFGTSGRTDPVNNRVLSSLFQAVVEATEEAIYNSLLRATTVRGKRMTAEAIPISKLRAVLRKYGRVSEGD